MKLFESKLPFVEYLFETKVDKLRRFFIFVCKIIFSYFNHEIEMQTMNIYLL